RLMRNEIDRPNRPSGRAAHRPWDPPAPARRYNRVVCGGLCVLTLLGLLATPTGSALGAGCSRGELALAAVAGLDPRQLSLRHGDLPPGFATSPVGTGFVDNAQAAAGGPADLPT